MSDHASVCTPLRDTTAFGDKTDVRDAHLACGSHQEDDLLAAKDGRRHRRQQGCFPVPLGARWLTRGTPKALVHCLAGFVKQQLSRKLNRDWWLYPSCQGLRTVRPAA